MQVPVSDLKVCTTHLLLCIPWSPVFEDTSVTSLVHRGFVQLNNPVKYEHFSTFKVQLGLSS